MEGELLSSVNGVTHKTIRFLGQRCHAILELYEKFYI